MTRNDQTVKIRSYFNRLWIGSLVAILLLALSRVASAQTLWTAQTGDWFTSTNWSDGVPDSGRDAQINNGGTAQILTGTANANNLYLGGGLSGSYTGTLTLAGSASLRVENNLSLSNFGIGTLMIREGAQVSSGMSLISGGTHFGGSPGLAIVDGAGSTWNTALSLNVDGSLKIQNGGSVVSNAAVISGIAVIDGPTSSWTTGEVVISAGRAGTLIIQNGGRLVSDDIAVIGDGPFGGFVMVDGAGSQWEMDVDQVQLNISSGASLSVTNGGVVSTFGMGVGAQFDGQLTVDGNSSALNVRTNLYIGGGDLGDGPEPGGVGKAQISNGGVINSPATTIFGRGILIVDGVLASRKVTVDLGGSLSGNGSINGDVATAGHVEPGDSIGVLAIQGSYSQSSTGVLTSEIAGPDSAAHDYLRVAGAATLDGTLEVRFVGGFLPKAHDVFNLVEVSGGVSGSFAQITFPDLRSGFQFSGEFVNGIYELTALNDAAPAIGLRNISTRGQVAPGEDAMIAGFIVTGTKEKKVIIRGLGPSLAINGMPLPGRLADPTLELHDNTGALISSNDNWMDSPDRQQIIDSTIPPSDDKEAAIVATLVPGNYTAILRGVGTSSGIGIVEVYDLSPNTDATLANISTRGLVGTADNVLIGGFITDDQNTTVLLRALGPSLASSGVQNVLADPSLKLYNADGEVVTSNNDWQDTDAVTIQNTGLAPIDPVESAIVATLGPGAFTAIVQGRNGAMGVGLLEIYNLR